MVRQFANGLGRWVSYLAVVLVAATAVFMWQVAARPGQTTETRAIASAGAGGGALTVSQALAQLEAGQLGSDPITLQGFWSSRVIPTGCAPLEPPPPPIMDVACNDGQYGVTEAREPIMRMNSTGGYQFAASPRLTPWIPQFDVAQRLVDGPRNDGLVSAPRRVVLSGHFNDATAARCPDYALADCSNRFVVDALLEIEDAVLVDEAPAPMALDPNAEPLFDESKCAGPSDYAFVGWTTTADLDLVNRPRWGPIYAMVLKEPSAVGEWVEDESARGGSYRIWGRLICFATLADPEVLEFALVPGTAVKEHADGTREEVEWD